MNTAFHHPSAAFPTPPLNDGLLGDMMDPMSLLTQRNDAQGSSQDQFLDDLRPYRAESRTTVVTTTTTTTTRFPPVIMNQPRSLVDRDPKQYPLAATSTPTHLRQFDFEFRGQKVFFEEQENGEEALFHIAHDATRSPSLKTPQRANGKGRAFGPPINPSQIAQRRGLSPVSITEAAEIASLQRRNKRPRLSQPAQLGKRSTSHQLQSMESIDIVQTCTPGTDDAVFKRPRSLRSRRIMGKEIEQGASKTAREIREGSSSLDNSPNVSRVLGPGVAATPPIVESDLEPVGPYELTALEPQISRPARVDTLAIQDAVLPSPSLSPITAAANLSQTHFAAFGGNDECDDDDAVSSFELPPGFDHTHEQASPFQSFPSHLHSGQNSLSAHNERPQIADVRSMLDTFDSLPSELQSYVMYQLLRRSAKPTLQFVADVVNPALKIDFLSLLPFELSANIVAQLDAKSMCRAAQVSKKWRHIVDSDEKAWKDLLHQDGYDLARGEIERAVKEGWGWQYPDGPNNYEKDLSQVTPPSSADGSLASPAFAANDTEPTTPTTSTANPKKRKHGGKQSNSKKRKAKAASPKILSPSWVRDLEAAQGPLALSSAAMQAVPDPGVGLPALTNMHLYKSLYHRNHSIRKSWMEENSQPRHFAFQAHGTHVVTCLQFDSDKILTGSDDTKINVFDTESGALRKTLDGHEGGVWALQYDGNLLVSGSTDRSVRVWDIESGQCLQIFQGHTSTVRCLIILKPVQVGEREDGTPIMMPEQPLIITGSRDSSLRVWKLPSLTDKSIFQAVATANDAENPYFVRVLNGHHHSVRAIAAHGDTLVSGSYDHTVRVWKISTGETSHRLIGHAQKVYSVVLDHQRNRCISGSMDNLVKVWSLENGACLFNLEGHTSLVGLLDLNHDRLVSAAADSTLRIWDPETGQCKSTLSAHTGAITCFQHDSQKVVSGSDRTLKMWNIRTGECVRDLLTGLSGVWQVKFNDRRCVAAVQRDHWTYIEVLDFGAARDVAYRNKLGTRIFVDREGQEVEDVAQAGTEAAGPAAA